MKLLRYVHGPLKSLLQETSTLAIWAARAVLGVVAGYVPWLSRHSRLWAVLALVLALVMQVMLVWLLGEMISLCITLMEVWAELAAKHLEITLDRT